MAGKVTALGLAAVLVVFTAPALQADSPTPSPGTPPGPPPRHFGPPGGEDGGGRRPKGDKGDKGDPVSPEDHEKFETVRKALEALTPEQRKRFQDNFTRWSNLSDEGKQALAERDAFRRKKIAEDIDAALKEAGLDLDPEHREAFAKRYGEERRKIEEQLRKDMDEKRRPLLKEVIAKLKAEFTATAASTPAPATAVDAPVPPPKPK